MRITTEIHVLAQPEVHVRMQLAHREARDTLALLDEVLKAKDNPVLRGLRQAIQHGYEHTKG